QSRHVRRSGHRRPGQDHDPAYHGNPRHHHYHVQSRQPHREHPPQHHDHHHSEHHQPTFVHHPGAARRVGLCQTLPHRKSPPHRDITSLNTYIGVGYWVFKNPEGFVRGVIPTFEGHLFTPLNHRNSADLITAPNVLTFTAGVNVVMPNNTTLGAAIAAPVTG